MHGFLNVAGAAVLATTLNFPHQRMVEILEEQDAGAFAFVEGEFRWRDYRADTSTIQAARKTLFTAYGSCSFTEPIDDLQALGILKAHGVPL
jgi:hypothetical protein